MKRQPWTAQRFRIMGYGLLVATSLIFTTLSLVRDPALVPLVWVAMALGLVAAFCIWRARVIDARGQGRAMRTRRKAA